MFRLVIFLFTLASNGSAREVQSHGLVFEQWLRDTFFNGHVPESYTQRWDIPAEANTQHGGIPANPKAIKYRTPLDFGDALRQFEITERAERFLLIIGFWEQATPTQKKWVNAQAIEVTPEAWSRLWTPVSRIDLEQLDRVIKDKSLSIEEARAQAQAIKKAPPFTQSIMQVNPKIDSQQRRLQCSLRFADFFRHLATNADSAKQAEPKVFGIAVPLMIQSSPRSLTGKNETGDCVSAGPAQ